MRDGPALRIGQGFDVHRFGPGDHIVLGGVRIRHEQGIVAHSDGDALLHALTDGLLGAAGLGDIGHFFPDDDPTWAGADSRELLRRAVRAARDAGWRPVNADCTVVTERPRLASLIPAMRENIASVLGIEIDAANVKATTAERMGFVGRGEGLAAFAVVLLTSA